VGKFVAVGADESLMLVAETGEPLYDARAFTLTNPVSEA